MYVYVYIHVYICKYIYIYVHIYIYYIFVDIYRQKGILKNNFSYILTLRIFYRLICIKSIKT